MLLQETRACMRTQKVRWCPWPCNAHCSKTFKPSIIYSKSFRYDMSRQLLQQQNLFPVGGTRTECTTS